MIVRMVAWASKVEDTAGACQAVCREYGPLLSMQRPDAASKAVVILKWIVVLQACCSLGDVVHVRGDAIKGGVPHQRLRPHHVRAYPGSHHRVLPCTLPSAQLHDTRSCCLLPVMLAPRVLYVAAHTYFCLIGALMQKVSP